MSKSGKSVQTGKSRRRRGDGRPTIADVAARAGVGAITVSRALRDPHLVSAPLRVSIEKAVSELNYIPSLSARALARTRSDVIGVLIPSLSQVVFTDVLRGIYDGAEGSPFTVQIGNTRYDPKEEARLVDVFLRQKPAGLIVSGVEQLPATRQMLEEAGCPVVQIMDLTSDPIHRIIGFSHEVAGRRMTEHLIEEGYEHIAFLSGWMSRRATGRLVGYHQALAAAGMPATNIAISAGQMPELTDSRNSVLKRPIREFATPRLGRQLLGRALEENPAIDAVFCNNDTLALGVLFECSRRGIRVPEQMGIAGFNDHDYMESAEPSLSSARTHRYRNGLMAVISIRDELAGKPDPQHIVDMGVDIMKRRSTDRFGRRARAE
jgi:LacI family gluconate utilization system Gnt-I transcriptional repressor